MLNEVNYHRPQRLNPGCVGILKWSDALSFEILDEPWLADFTRGSYREL